MDLKFNQIINELEEDIERKEREIDSQIAGLKFDRAVETDEEVIQKINVELKALYEKKEKALSDYSSLEDTEAIKEQLRKYYIQKRIEVASDEEIQSYRLNEVAQLQKKIAELQAEIQKDLATLEELKHLHQTPFMEENDLKTRMDQLKKEYVNEKDPEKQDKLLSEAKLLAVKLNDLKQKTLQREEEASKKSKKTKNRIDENQQQLQSVQEKLSIIQNTNDYRKCLSSPFRVDIIEKNLIFLLLRSNSDLEKEVFALLYHFYKNKIKCFATSFKHMDRYLSSFEIKRLFPDLLPAYNDDEIRISLEDQQTYLNLISYFKKQKEEFLKKQEKIKSIDSNEIPSWEWIEDHNWLKVPMDLSYDKTLLGYTFCPSPGLLDMNLNLVMLKKRIIKNYDVKQRINSLSEKLYERLSDELKTHVRDVIDETYFQGENEMFRIGESTRLDASSIKERISTMLAFASRAINEIELFLSTMQVNQISALQSNEQMYEQLINSLQTLLGVSEKGLVLFIQKIRDKSYYDYNKFHDDINNGCPYDETDRKEIDAQIKQNKLLLSLIPYLDEKAYHNANQFSKGGLLPSTENSSTRKRLPEEGLN